MISVEELLQRLAVRSGTVFAVADRPFHAREVLGAEGFSFMPLVVLQAVRDVRELSVGMESELDLDLIGAICSPGEAPFGISVSVRPLVDEVGVVQVGVLRGLLFQQAAERLFAWNQQPVVDLQAVIDGFNSDGYHEERELLEAYAANVAVRQDVLKEGVQVLP
ncbi:hypothetical protein [Variovorax gossypii]|uniref:hypothetical protein n=1 Tax=uncultured Variovorax sp. TaxID=114708 RepID=UPI00263148F3|nr:hypothetical protein [uncultured Variovorax sp.]